MAYEFSAYGQHRVANQLPLLSYFYLDSNGKIAGDSKE
jgi:hypothetical protein